MCLLKHDIKRLKVLLILCLGPRAQSTLEFSILQRKELRTGNPHESALLRATLYTLPVEGRLPEDRLLADDIATAHDVSNRAFSLDAHL